MLILLVRIFAALYIRGVPKVYHTGDAIAVGVRREKTGGRRMGMQENRKTGATRAGNRTENGDNRKR